MLSLQKAVSDRIGLGYDFSSPNITSSSAIVFVSPADNVNSENNEFKTEIASENLDKGKSILGTPLKVEKKETRNPRTKKINKKEVSTEEATSLSSLWSFRAYLSKLLQMVSHLAKQ